MSKDPKVTTLTSTIDSEPTDREILESQHSDAFKAWCGVRPRTDQSRVSDEQLRQEIEQFYEWAEREKQQHEEAEKRYQEELEHRNRYIPNNVFAELEDLLKGR